MSDLNLTVAQDALKEFYLIGMRTLINKQTIAWDRIARYDKFNPEGKNWTIPLNTARHTQALAGRPENGTLPAVDSQEYKKAVVPAAYLYTSIQISGPVIRATRSDKGAFIRAVSSEVQGAANDSRKSANRQLHGNGTDGLAYYVSGSGTSIVVDDGKGNVFTYLQPKATTVDLIDSSDNSTVLNAGITITLGDEVATGFNATLGTAVSGSVAAGDYFVLASSLGFQMTGLQAIVSDTDPVLLAGGLHGLTVSGRPWWKSQIVGSESAKQDFRFHLLQRVLSKIAMNSARTKDDVKFILTSPFGRDKYVERCTEERRAVNVMKLDGGYEGVSFNGTPIVDDVDCPLGRYYAIVPDALRICQMADFSWMDEDGAMLNRVPGKDAYNATLFAYMNFATLERNALGALVGINM